MVKFFFRLWHEEYEPGILEIPKDLPDILNKQTKCVLLMTQVYSQNGLSSTVGSSDLISLRVISGFSSALSKDGQKIWQQVSFLLLEQYGFLLNCFLSITLWLSNHHLPP